MVIKETDMNITVYTGFSKEVNSTKQPTGGTNVSCVLKDDTSIIHPAFKLQGVGYDVNYVKWNDRYYFVDDIVSLSNNIKEIRCSVDALATYKTQIGASSQYVIRSSSAYDEYIIDHMYPADVRTNIQTVEIDLGLDINNTTFVLGVVNSESNASGGITYYCMTASMLAQLMNYLFGGNWLDAPLTELSLELQKELVNPFQYIVSCMAFPFDVFDSGFPHEHIKFGYWTMDSMASYIIPESGRYKNSFAGVQVPRHPQSNIRGAYLNSAPFTRMSLSAYGFGTCALDPQDFVSNTQLSLNLLVDKYTGTGKIRVSNTGDSNTLFELNGQIGVPIQISQITQNLVSAGLAGVATGVSAIAGNPLGIASGIASAVQSVMPQIHTAGSVGSMVNFLKKPILTMQFKNLVTVDNEHLGRPLMQRRTLSSIPGFIIVEQPDVDIPGTSHEKDQIIQYMRSGFYYE